MPEPCAPGMRTTGGVQSLVDVGLMEPVNEVVVRSRQVQLLPLPRALMSLPSQPTVLQALYGTRKKLTATQWHVYGVEHMLPSACVLNHPGMGATLQTFFRRPEGRDARAAADTLAELTATAEGPHAWRIGQVTPLGAQDASPFRIGDVDPGVPLLTMENGSSIAVAAPHVPGNNYLLVRRPSGHMFVRKFSGCFLVRRLKRRGAAARRSALAAAGTRSAVAPRACLAVELPCLPQAAALWSRAFAAFAAPSLHLLQPRCPAVSSGAAGWRSWAGQAAVCDLAGARCAGGAAAAQDPGDAAGVADMPRGRGQPPRRVGAPHAAPQAEQARARELVRGAPERLRQGVPRPRLPIMRCYSAAATARAGHHSRSPMHSA